MAATIALQSAVHHFGRLDGAATVDWSRRAVDLAGPESPVGRRARTYLAHGLAYSGRTAEAFAALDGAEGDVTDPEVAWLQPRSARGLLRMVEDDLDGARADFHAVATRAYELGVLNIAAFAFAYLARAEYLAGAWDDAVVHAERAVAVNDESDWGFTWPTVVGIAVLVPAARGEWAAAEAAAGRRGGPVSGGLRAVGRGGGDEPGPPRRGPRRRRGPGRRPRAGAVVPHPRRGRRARVLGVAGPVRRRAGRRSAGSRRPTRCCAPHEERAAERGRLSSIARLARARGRVEAAAGRPDRAEAAFERALDASGRVRLPFERAKIELAAGGFLRRTGRRRRAVELLTSAAAAFERLGAAPYAARCHVELAGSGLHPAPRDGGGSSLTSQELVVARLAAVGRTNREIAGELVVSVKTVEYHLRNAFTKLGITRRRQLAARLGGLPA